MLKIPALQKNKNKKETQQTGSVMPILLCLITAMTLFGFLLSVQQKQLDNFEKDIVLTASQHIPKNTEITAENYSKYFTLTEMPVTNIPSAACMEAEDLIGLYCTADIDVGNMITASMFVQTVETLSKDHVLLSINTSSLDQNVAGTLRAGDVVDVYVVTEQQDDEYIAVQIGSQISVERSYDSSGTAITRDDTQTVAQVVTIPMPSSDTAYFLEALEKGTVKIVKYKSY